MPYNEAHVEFVSHHSGTTVLEVFVAIILPQTLFLYKQLLLSWPKLTLGNIYTRFAAEFIIIVLPQLLVFTVLNEYCVRIALGLWAMCLLIIAVQLFRLYSVPKCDHSAIKQRFETNNNFISEGRSLTFIGTAICILAVDFQIFPRRFAKTEKYGFGVMDLGIGFFIVIHAYASGDARGIYRRLSERFRRLVYSNVPLIFLGILRVVAVKSSGYHEHVSEYGFHWNFFFTLAAIKIFAGVLFIKFNPRFSFLLGLILILIYQTLLNVKNYTGYIMEDSALNYQGLLYYLHNNRSGLFSTLGNVAMFLASVQLGLHFHTSTRNSLNQWISYVVSLFSLSFLLLGLMYACNSYVQLVSRKLSNVTYVVFVLSYVSFYIATALLCNLACAVKQHINSQKVAALRKRPIKILAKSDISYAYQLNFTSVLLNSVDSNAMVHFVFSNIATGAVNLYIKTIYSSSVVSFIILLLYTLITCLLPFIIELKRWKMKQQRR
ncbi:hypothetical protein CHUAL_011794 [Chamberlinius hualienensis]